MAKKTEKTEANPRRTGNKDNSHKSGKQAQARAQRRLEAQERQAEYDALPLEEKVARAVAAPGASVRELKRLRSKAS